MLPSVRHIAFLHTCSNRDNMPSSKCEWKLERNVKSCHFKQCLWRKILDLRMMHSHQQLMWHVTRMECPWISVIVTYFFLHSGISCLWVWTLCVLHKWTHKVHCTASWLLKCVLVLLFFWQHKQNRRTYHQDLMYKKKNKSEKFPGHLNKK